MPYPLIPIGGNPWVALIGTLIFVAIVVGVADWVLAKAASGAWAKPWIVEVARGVIYIVAGLYVLALLLSAFFGVQLFAGVGRG